MNVPKFDPVHLEAICNVLADTADGLTGTEIGNLLSQLGVDDPLPVGTKRVRLCRALSERQDRDRCGNLVAAFVNAAMNPVRFVSDTAQFEARRNALNSVLGFAGYSVGADGKLARVPATATLSEAQTRARALAGKLRARDVHGDVLRFCQAELLEDNYFHAVLEATKSVAAKLRSKSGCTGDGTPLVDCALGGQNPLIAVNRLATESDRTEHRGFANLLRGMFGVFRNPTAHEPKITWPIGEQDALDLLSLASYMHRRLDAAVRIR